MSDLRDAKHVIWDFSDNIVYIYVWTIVHLLATRLAFIAVLLISIAFCFNFSSFSRNSFSFFISLISMAVSQLLTSISSAGDSCKSD